MLRPNIQSCEKWHYYQSQATQFDMTFQVVTPIDLLWPYLCDGTWLSFHLLPLLKSKFKVSPSDALPPMWKKNASIEYVFLPSDSPLKFLSLKMKSSQDHIQLQILTFGGEHAAFFQSVLQGFKEWIHCLEQWFQSSHSDTDLPLVWQEMISEEPLILELWNALQLFKICDPARLIKQWKWSLKSCLELCSILLDRREIVLYMGSWKTPLNYHIQAISEVFKQKIPPHFLLDRDCKLYLGLPKLDKMWGSLPLDIDSQNIVSGPTQWTWDTPQILTLESPGVDSFQVRVNKKGSPEITLSLSEENKEHSSLGLNGSCLITSDSAQLLRVRSNINRAEYFHWGHLVNAQWIQDFFPQTLPMHWPKYGLDCQFFLCVELISQDEEHSAAVSLADFKYLLFQMGGQVIQWQNQIALLGFSTGEQALSVAASLLELYQVAFSWKRLTPHMALHQGPCQVFQTEKGTQFLGSALRKTFEILAYSEGFDLIFTDTVLTQNTETLSSLPGEIIRFHPLKDNGYSEAAYYQWTF